MYLAGDPPVSPLQPPCTGLSWNCDRGEHPCPHMQGGSSPLVTPHLAPASTYPTENQSIVLRGEEAVHQNWSRKEVYRVFRSYHQKNFPVGLHDAYNAQDREAEEADANKHANPGCCVDVVIVGGFKQWVEAVLV